MVFRISDNLNIMFGVDAIALEFIGLVTVMWALSAVFMEKYKEHLSNMKQYYIFYCLTYVMLCLLALANNYFTMYLCFELMTLCSMPLVLQTGTKEALEGAKKYLFYSIFGATMGLTGFFFEAIAEEKTQLIVAFISIMGFGAKAGLFPLHAWLPTAHPVAPAPASAVLSGVITKAGVLCIYRLIYFYYTPEFLDGTWVQKALISVALLTVLMGSTMAYAQDVLKKRLAYSTVSQVSYILFGIFTMNAIALKGAMMHVLFHSMIKDLLFLGAGSIIFYTHKEKVSEMRGVGRQLPWTMATFSVASLGLVGIPPLAGFMSKWYLATGSLSEGIPVLSWLGPVVLLLSALLTALYLFPICINAFFPGDDFTGDKTRIKESENMVVPMVILAVAIIALGMTGGDL